MGLLKKIDIVYEAVESNQKLQGIYDSFNTKYFNNELPKIPIKMTRTKVNGGSVIGSKQPDDTHFTPKEMKISSAYDYTEEQLKSTIFHEMIHVYVYVHVPASIVKREDQHGASYMELFNKYKDIVDFPLTIGLDGSYKQKPTNNRVDAIAFTSPDNKVWFTLYKKGVLSQQIDDLDVYSKLKKGTTTKVYTDVPIPVELQSLSLRQKFIPRNAQQGLDDITPENNPLEQYEPMATIYGDK